MTDGARRFTGHIGNEPFEGTLEEWACRLGGAVGDANTVSVDLNTPAPLMMATRFSKTSSVPERWTITAGHRPGKVCAGALRHPIPLRGASR